MEPNYSKLIYNLNYMCWYSYALKHLNDDTLMNPCCLFVLSLLKIYGANYPCFNDTELYYCQRLRHIGLIRWNNSLRYELSPVGSAFVDHFLPHYERFYFLQILMMLLRFLALFLVSMTTVLIVVSVPLFLPSANSFVVIDMLVAMLMFAVADFAVTLIMYAVDTFLPAYQSNYASQATKSNLIQFILNHNVDHRALNKNHVQKEHAEINLSPTFSTEINSLFASRLKLSKRSLLKYLIKHSASYRFLISEA